MTDGETDFGFEFTDDEALSKEGASAQADEKKRGTARTFTTLFSDQRPLSTSIATQLILNGVLTLESFHPSCWPELQRETQTIMAAEMDMRRREATGDPNDIDDGFFVNSEGLMVLPGSGWARNVLLIIAACYIREELFRLEDFVRVDREDIQNTIKMLASWKGESSRVINDQTTEFITQFETEQDFENLLNNAGDKYTDLVEKNEKAVREKEPDTYKKYMKSMRIMLKGSGVEKLVTTDAMKKVVTSNQEAREKSNPGVKSLAVKRKLESMSVGGTTQVSKPDAKKGKTEIKEERDSQVAGPSGVKPKVEETEAEKELKSIMEGKAMPVDKSADTYRSSDQKRAKGTKSKYMRVKPLRTHKFFQNFEVVDPTTVKAGKGEYDPDWEREPRKPLGQESKYTYSKQRDMRNELQFALAAKTRQRGGAQGGMNGDERRTYQQAQLRLAKYCALCTKIADDDGVFRRNRAILTTENLREAWKWFDQHDERLQVLESDAIDFNYVSAGDQHQTNLIAKTYFCSFLVSANMTDKIHAGTIAMDFNATFQDAQRMIVMLRKMKELYDFEGVPIAGLAEQGNAHRLHMAKVAMDIVRRYMEDGDVDGWVDFGAGDTKENLKKHSPPSFENHCMAVADEDWAEFEEKTNQCIDYLTTYPGTPDQKGKWNELAYRIRDCLVSAADRREEAARNTKQIVHCEQEANLSRIFHFLRALYRSNNTPPTQEQMNVILDMLGGIQWSVNHTDLQNKCQQTGNPWLNRIVLITKINGEGAFHKIQSPFLLSAKRFANGAACFCHLQCTAQFMNLLQLGLVSAAMIAHLDVITETVQGCEIQKLGLTQNENTMYARTRISFYMLQSFLKGNIDASVYTGLKQGNALNVTIQDTALTTPRQDDIIRKLRSI